MQILEGLLIEFEEWRRRRSGKEPLIVRIHNRVVSSDRYAERGEINLDLVSAAIYSAVEDLIHNHDVSRCLAVLTYHFVTSHPFVNGNKRTALGLLLHILHEMFDDEIPLSPDSLEALITTLAEVADNPPEEDERAINKIRSVIQRIIED
jgi:death-on-curing family protein